MAFWWRKNSGNGAPALRGAPAVRRMKTYAAMSGYIYHYFYEGMRDPAEYVFELSADRKNWFFVSVFVEPGRELPAQIQYGVAKLALFAAFDERELPERMREPVRVNAESVAELLRRLDFEPQ